jgi:hypothetical protein
MFAAQFALGLKNGLSKAEICAKPEMGALSTKIMSRVWGGTPKAVTLLLALSMLLDLCFDCNGPGIDGSGGTGVSPGVVPPLVLLSQAGGSGGVGLNLGRVLLHCEACTGQDECLELAFIRECITTAAQMWLVIVQPYCKEVSGASYIKQNTYLGALIPSLLQKIRIVGPGGALEVVSGSCLIKCFERFFLNAPQGHFNNDNATDLLIILMSVANVDFTAHPSVEEADGEDCCVDKVLKACLEDDSHSDRASVLRTPSWQSLLCTLEGASDGLNPGGVVQCSFSTELRSRRVRAIRAKSCSHSQKNKRKADKQLEVSGRLKQMTPKDLQKSHQGSGDDGGLRVAVVDEVDSDEDDEDLSQLIYVPTRNW